MWIIPIIIALLALLYLFSLHGRTGRMRLRTFQKFAYAHRGLHNEAIPENSMAAFKAALDHGYGIELDVHLLKDGHLAVIHDHSLLRTAGVDVEIEDLTADDLENYRLGQTEEKIPLFQDVLAMWGGKTPLIIELKSRKNNYADLTEAAVAAMKGCTGAWCMESFDPRCLRHLKKHYPNITRGQLSEDFIHNPKVSAPFVLKLLMTLLVTNFLTNPDFVAYEFEDRKVLSLQLCRKLWRLPMVAWTLKTQEEFDLAMEDGCIPIFEGFLP